MEEQDAAIPQSAEVAPTMDASRPPPDEGCEAPPDIPTVETLLPSTEQDSLQPEPELEIPDDVGHSNEGRERGEDLSPEEVGIRRVIEATAEYTSSITFAELGLPEVLLEGVRARGYLQPTPVQTAAYPHALEGNDLIVRSKTGTGKTAAFMLPLLARIPAGDRHTRAIVLAPTRELALQVADEGIALAQYKDVSVVPIYGGVGMGLQTEQLRKGAEVVVGTPGRVLDHIRRGNLDTSQVMISVLDEADEMLSMGFLEEVRTILKRLPKDHQCLLFSATVDASVAGLISQFMDEPVELLLSADRRTVDHIENVLYECSDSYPKARSLLYVLYLESPESAIIFCNTRDDCAFVTHYLNRQGFEAEFINSDLPQKERERVMGRLRSGELSFLVATDIAARGIDISDLSHVINYSLPEDPDIYLHRVGRTGRIGKLGTAISLVSGRDLSAELALQRRYKIPWQRKTLPSPEEAARLWTERHLEKLRAAADRTAFEAYIPMAGELVRSLPEDERNRLIATALRIFFSWSRTSQESSREGGPPESTRPSREGAEASEGWGNRDRERSGDGRRESRTGGRRDDRRGDRRDGVRSDRRDDRRDSPAPERHHGHRDEPRPGRQEGPRDERREDRRESQRPCRRDDRRDDRSSGRPRSEEPVSDRQDVRQSMSPNERSEGIPVGLSRERSNVRMDGGRDLERRERPPRGREDLREDRASLTPIDTAGIEDLESLIESIVPADLEPAEMSDRSPHPVEEDSDEVPRSADPDAGDPGEESEASGEQRRSRRRGRRGRGRRGGREEGTASPAASGVPAAEKAAPDALLDPLAAFAAANDIDLSHLIDDDLDDSLLDEDSGSQEPDASGEAAPSTPGSSGERRGRRRNWRRRRGRRSGVPGSVDGGAGSGHAGGSGENGGTQA